CLKILLSFILRNSSAIEDSWTLSQMRGQAGKTDNVFGKDVQKISRKDAAAQGEGAAFGERSRRRVEPEMGLGNRGAPLPPCVKKVARRSRRQRNLWLGHELI